MKSGYLHIRRNLQDANWTKTGYGYLTVMPKCYTSDLLPFYFKHLLGGGSPGEGDSCKTFSLEKLKTIAGTEVVETTISLNNDAVDGNTSGDAMIFNYQNGCGDLGYISAGVYRYKIVTFDDITYYSEPFQVCLDRTHLLLTGASDGGFSNGFSNGFDI